MRTIALLTLSGPLLLTVACASVVDQDDDGLSDAEEAELGTDPDSAYTDGDGISDADEVDGATDPLQADSDGDGLSDGVELDGGTDPLRADSDGDGLGDGEEAQAGSDPNNGFSWPGDGVWPDRRGDAASDGVDGSSYGVGEQFPNFTAVDRYGTEVELYQFYGQVIAIDFSAPWCSHNRVLAVDAEALWNEQRDDGFVIIHAMTSGWDHQTEVTERTLNVWADEFGLTFPVPGHRDSFIEPITALYRAGLYEGLVPFLVVIDADMVLDSAYTGIDEAAEIGDRVAELLAAE